MDFDWTSAQLERRERILALARDGLNAAPAEGFSRERWRRCAEAGLLGLSVPQEYGGQGLSVLDTARAIEAFGEGCEDMGLVFAAAAHLLACAMPVVEFGGDQVKREVLPRMCSGERIGANAITEAEAGSDLAALQTRAVAEGDAYVLTGRKSWVSNGPVADVFIVYAATDPTAGYLGTTGFVIPRGTAGLEPGPPFLKMGLDGCSAGVVELAACRVPAAWRLGAEGQGARIFQASMRWERTCLFAAYVGLMERQLARCVAHARKRRQFRKPIGRNQAVSHRLADMKLRLEAARLLLYRACWRIDTGGDATMDVAMAKIAISEAAIQSGLDSLQIFGAAGYASANGIESGLRDSVPSTIFSGTSEIHRELIARGLGL